MSTRRESIILAAIAALNDLDTVPPERIFRSRATAITRDEAPCVVIRKQSEDGPAVRNVAEYRLAFTIEVHARGDDGEAQADPIEAEIHAKLMADRALGGACTLLSTDGTEWEGADADQAAHRTLMHFSALYRVEPEDLSQSA